MYPFSRYWQDRRPYGRPGRWDLGGERTQPTFDRPRTRQPRRYMRWRSTQPLRDELWQLKDEYRQGILEFHRQECPYDCCEAYCDMVHPRRGERARRKPERLKSGYWNYLPIRCLEYCEDPTCPFSHSDEEVQYHPLKYKTVPCAYSLDAGDCCKQYGYFCPFFHQEVDKYPLPALAFNYYNRALPMPDLDTFMLQSAYRELMKSENLKAEGPSTGKTPQKPQSDQFSRAKYKVERCATQHCENILCTRYHSAGERRRENDAEYDFLKCQNVYSSVKNAFNDSALCPRGEKCPHSHTQNEVDYHKDKYKTELCTVANCSEIHCSFLHGVLQKPTDSKAGGNAQFSLLESMCAVSIEIGGLKTQIEEASEALLKLEKQLKCSGCRQHQQFALLCGHTFCQECIEDSRDHRSYVCAKCCMVSEEIIQIRYIS